jgi:F-type H+-transporting ATPase subunit b
MSSQQHEPTRIGIGSLAASGALLALSGCSVSSGADILIPKPAEFIPSLIAFIVIWVLLAKLAWPSILKQLDERQQKIQGDIDAAEESRQKAAEDQEAYAEKLASAQAQADQIIADAKRQAEEERSRILAKAQEDASATIAKAHDAVDSERRKAMIELSSSVVDLSVDIASKIIGNDLSADDQRRLAEKYLEEVGKSDDDQQA